MAAGSGAQSHGLGLAWLHQGADGVGIKSGACLAQVLLVALRSGFGTPLGSRESSAVRHADQMVGIVSQASWEALALCG